LTAGAAQKKVWTILEMLQWGTSYLAEKGFEESRLTVELLLAHTLRLKRIQLYTSFDRPIDEEELSVFKTFFQRRLQHEPLQYIVGSTEFMGLKFSVDKRVLIPRPETEVLVELAVRFMRKNFPDQSSRSLDIGTGSGCIAVSLAGMIAAAIVTAVDVSENALAVAEANARTNGVDDRVKVSVLDIFHSDGTIFPEKFHLIVSNPPYISATEFAILPPEIREHEPPLATTDGGDGLSFYRRIATAGRAWLEPGGAVIVEFGSDQPASVQKIFSDSGWHSNEVINDFDGNPRCLLAR
jgi:release factor glutamine methyltransferase